VATHEQSVGVQQQQKRRARAAVRNQHAHVGLPGLKSKYDRDSIIVYGSKEAGKVVFGEK
jgi:hypothetical protein